MEVKKTVWIARDCNDDNVYMYQKKPVRKGFRWMFPFTDMDEVLDIGIMPDELCEDISWEDEPVEVELIFKKK